MRLSKDFLMLRPFFAGGELFGGISLTPRHTWRGKKVQKCDCLQIRCKSSVKYCSKLIARHKDYKYIQQFLQGKVEGRFPARSQQESP